MNKEKLKDKLSTAALITVPILIFGGIATAIIIPLTSKEKAVNNFKQILSERINQDLQNQTNDIAVSDGTKFQLSFVNVKDNTIDAIGVKDSQSFELKYLIPENINNINDLKKISKSSEDWVCDYLYTDNINALNFNIGADYLKNLSVYQQNDEMKYCMEHLTDIKNVYAATDIMKQNDKTYAVVKMTSVNSTYEEHEMVDYTTSIAMSNTGFGTPAYANNIKNLYTEKISKNFLCEQFIAVEVDGNKEYSSDEIRNIVKLQIMEDSKQCEVKVSSFTELNDNQQEINNKITENVL